MITRCNCLWDRSLIIDISDVVFCERIANGATQVGLSSADMRGLTCLQRGDEVVTGHLVSREGLGNLS
jgi:hypothetical protein